MIYDDCCLELRAVRREWHGSRRGDVHRFVGAHDYRGRIRGQTRGFGCRRPHEQCQDGSNDNAAESNDVISSLSWLFSTRKEIDDDQQSEQQNEDSDGDDLSDRQKKLGKT